MGAQAGGTAKEHSRFPGLWDELQKMAFSAEHSENWGLQNAQGVDTLVCLPVELRFLFWNKSFRKQRPVIWQQT